MNHESLEVEQAEELVRRVLPTLHRPVSPNFRAQVLARAEALSASRRHRSLRWGMPSWVQNWTPALAVGLALVFAFTFWVNGPFAPEWARHSTGNGSLGVRETTPRSTGDDSPEPRGRTPRLEEGKILHRLIQEGLRQEKMRNIPQAVAAYREAVNQVALPLNQLAWLAYQQGEAVEGLPLARLAVQLQPEKANYQDTLASILCALGQREEAIEVMTKAARLWSEKYDEKLAQFRQGACR